MWLHVDGAYGGTLAVVPEYRYVLDGVESRRFVRRQSAQMAVHAVRLLGVFRAPRRAQAAFSLVPEYLVTRDQDDVVNYMDYGVQLGRRFRALKLWMVIRAFGTAGLADRLRAHCALAHTFAGWVESAGDWELTAPVAFSLVCFRYAPRGRARMNAIGSTKRSCMR